MPTDHNSGWLPVADKSGPSTSPDYGLHTLIARDPLTAGVTDIVAVHGLNGHYEKTWTEDLSGYNWLRDAFSGANRSQFTARVLSFSYNAKVQHSKSTADIFDFAAQLLECLLLERQTDLEQSRPIIFICHSLGGIIFKHAFNRASGESRYKTLSQKFAGALFFGTPHKGSAIAGAASILGKVMKGASFGTNTNTQLLKDLEIHSVKLEQISDMFLQMAEQLRIVTFYELDKMDYMNSVVVDKESAIMRMRNEVAVPLNGNHRTICRYSSRSDKSLGIVLGHLATIIRRITATGSQTDEDFLLRDLATSNPDLHKSRNPRPVRGTCGWILEHDTYKNWLQTRRSALLWLSADPGCGKSVLASFLVDKLRSEHAALKQTNICYFFFKSDNEEQRDAVYGLQAILHQLLQAQRELLRTAVKELNGKQIRKIDALWRALVKVVEEPAARETICILDGLDECEPESRKALTRVLSEFFAPPRDSMNDSERNRGKLKFLISSRPENSLKIAFDRTRPSASKPCSMIRLRGEDEIDAISRDIGLVIDAEIADVIDRGLPEELLEEVRHELVARADRTFLWVTLILQLLRDKVEAGASRRELHEALENRSIDAIYGGLLSARPDAPKARKLLSLVLAASRPLTVEELSIALAIKPEVETFASSDRPKRPGDYCINDIEDELVYPFENHIKALCGHFIRIIRNNVYLVHETAREFLLESPDAQLNEQVEDEWFALDDDQETLRLDDGASTITNIEKSMIRSTSWQNSFDLLSCHAIMLEVCVTFLYCVGKTSTAQPAGEPSRRTAPFLDYAAVEWHSHFRQVCERLNVPDIPYYQNLCHPRFPGFEAWVSVWEHHEAQSLEFTAGTTTTRLRQGGMSDDEMQDHFVTLLAIESEGGASATGARRRYVLDAVADLGSATRNLSNNPTAGANHYFPVTANASGWVSLNVAQTRKGFNEMSSPWDNPWEE